MNIQDKIFSISNSSKKKINTLLTRIEYDPLGSDEYVFNLRKAAYSCLDDSILTVLTKQMSGESNLPFMTFKNLPFEDVNSSPSIGESWKKCKKTCLSENLIAMFAAIIGEPYSISFEGYDLVNNLVPYKETTEDYSGLGSNVELDFHIENAALKFSQLGDFSPRGLFLNAIRLGGNNRPNTRVSSGKEAIKTLNNKQLSELYKSNFILKVPHRWRDSFTSDKDITGLIPAITGNLEYPTFHLAFYSDMMFGVTLEAQNALEALHSAVRKCSIARVICPGEMMYVDNRYSFHSRDKFKATYDSDGRAHRWLQRVFVSDSLWDFRNMIHNKRVFMPELEVTRIAA